MDKDTFLSKIQEIGTCEDDVTRRSLLLEVTDGIKEVYDKELEHTSTIDSLNNTITNKDKDIERLREDNMKLFLRIGEQKSPEEITKDSTGIEQKPESNKRKFEDLFK